MDFPTALNDVKLSVDKELSGFFLTKRNEAKKIHPQTLSLVDAISDLTSRGGKRTRAFLVWLGYYSVIPVNKDDKLLYAMMAIELFQSFALIHDDIIDEDAMRRGSPTVHEHFKSKVKSHLPASALPEAAASLQAGTHQALQAGKSKVKSVHFGESMAILAGDLALVWADELMSICHSGLRAGIQSYSRWIPGQARDDRNGMLLDVLNIYQQMKQEVILGQSLDVRAAAGLPSADRATINRYKTAWYSVVRPLQIGASVAGADKTIIESFVPYGLAVGEGYQLRDDFLDGDVSDDAFRVQSMNIQDQVIQSIKNIHASQVVMAVFEDFARFALERTV
ncbi:MAG: polyprenyl synthetase family protein [Candidatus Gottesmanbacteria bacterium]|nr:polyprenyl synthetase family protein [Candidatus Gottesmanbacteria bacterium]